MAEKDSSDFDILIFLVQRIITILASSGICARIKYGTIGFEFKIHDGVVTGSRPSVQMDVRGDVTTK